jgi:uncharacterized protein YceK
MRLMICLCAVAAMLSGCSAPMNHAYGTRGGYEGPRRSYASLSARDKLRVGLALIKDTRENVHSASCPQLDVAMAYSFLLYKIVEDNKNNASLSAKYRVRGFGLILKGDHFSFKREFARRCPGTPKAANRTKQLYSKTFRKFSKERAKQKRFSRPDKNNEQKI